MAASVVSRLTGADVVIQDDGSRGGMVDLRVAYQNRAPGFVEVVTDITPGYASLYAELLKRGGQVPHICEAAGLDRVWLMTVSERCELKRLTTSAPMLLSRLATAGTTDGFVAGHGQAVENPEVAQLMRMGVVQLSCRPLREDESARMLVWPEGVAGPVVPNWEAFLGWIDRKLTSKHWQDNARKLSATKAAERHLFIGVSFSTVGEVFLALSYDHQSLPPAPPRLPSAFTHLWIMPIQGPGRCLAWFPDRGWFDPCRHWASEGKATIRLHRGI
jgi:hypothetical protein